MRNIRYWYKLLDRSGVVANDSGPGAANGTLSGDVSWLPFFGPPYSVLDVSGTLSPDATGDYLYTAINDTKPYYRLSSSYVLWYGSSDSYWLISPTLGTPGSDYWNNADSSPLGTFYPAGSNTGNPLVTGLYSAPFDYKGVVVGSSVSRITSAAAAGFPTDAGSIEMLVRPYWNNADGIKHYLWDTYGGNNRQFILLKDTDNKTYLYTNTTSHGSFTFAWTAHTLYHVVLNWGTNTLYINKVLVKTYTAGGLGTGANTLYIADAKSGINSSFNGIIYYFIARDVALTLAEITEFYNFFTPLYIPQPT
jgi:hypothetical protein